MELGLKQIKNIIADNCITIILNTHRTAPDNKKDGLVLKNLIKDAEQRLTADENKRNAQKLVDRLNDLAATIDHNHNLESLILFVNEDIAQFKRLAISVEDRVVIDNTFATRDLVRSLHMETGYYILVLSRDKARLLEVFNDKLVQEYQDEFPIENDSLYSTSKAELSYADKQTNLVAEFFNRIDKEVNKIWNENPLPILICTEESNYHQYLKIADRKEPIYDMFLNKNRLDEKAQAIITEAWKMVKEHTVKQNEERKSSLEKAVGRNDFLSDTNDIYRAIKEGRVQTIFIEKGKFQPATWKNDEIEYVSHEDRDKKDVVDDIYDELIEINMNYGGDVVFLPEGELSKFNGFGAITRY